MSVTGLIRHTSGALCIVLDGRQMPKDELSIAIADRITEKLDQKASLGGSL